MPFDLLRKHSQPGVSIAIISAACCMPGMAPLDEQARRIVEQALTETGVQGQVQIVPATKAFFGAVPRSVMAELIQRAQTGELPVPAVLIDGKAVAYGLAELKDFKSALLAVAAADSNTRTQEKPNESPA